MILKLQDLVSIFTGHTFRGRIENDFEGDCFVLQMKDLNSSYHKIESVPHLTKSNGILPKQFLQSGDVLFIAKGSNNFSLVFSEGYKAVASSVFFVLRPDKEKINPFFLSWYLNQTPAQVYLCKGKEGSMVTNINKTTLEELPIEVPQMETQVKIAKLHELMQKEIFLTEAILKKKRLFIENELLISLK